MAKKPATKPKPAQGQLFAVVGSDEPEVKRVAREMAIQLAPTGGGDFGTEIIDGAVDTVDQAASRIYSTIDALRTLPFFGGEKLVWLKSAAFLGDNVTGRSQTVLDALEKLVEVLSGGLGADTKFLLSAIDIDKRRTFFKALSKLATVEVFDKLDTSRSGWEEQVEVVVREMAGRFGLKFTADALELFVLQTGGDTGQIQNELDKIDLYLGTRRQIEIADVRLIVPQSRAGVIWDLGNAIARRDPEAALALIDQLIFQGESPVGILLVAIIPTVRNLLIVKDLMVRLKLPRPQVAFHFAATLNRLPESDTRHLPRKKDGGVNAFALGIAACHAHRFQLEELVDGLDACLDANVQLVTSGLDPKLLLQQLVIRLVAQKAAAA